ncbi:class I mannose-6-phosphate isomerase, partial [Novosphingobium sp. 18052]
TIAKGIGRQGKEECWLIIAAEPGARLGIGFDADLDEAAMRAAALDGSIEHLLTWHTVAPGDFFYIPANTVHAIGAGVGLIEVQQNSDITYRLYDYGRPRELHLEDGVAVSKGERYARDRWHKSVAPRSSQQLVDGPLFLLDQVAGTPSPDIAARYPAALLVIPREGEVEVGGEAIAPGGCALVTSLADVRFADNGICLLARGCADAA